MSGFAIYTLRCLYYLGFGEGFASVTGA